MLIRPCDADRDRAACRQLWVQLTEHHRQLYRDPKIGGEEPGLQFDDYLKHDKLAAVWVAEDEDRVIGLCGLLVDGTDGELEPIVVEPAFRARGVGKALVQHVVDDARRRGLRYLNVRPVARNAAAISFFAEAGFWLLSRVELSQSLATDNRGKFDQSVDLHGQRFRS